MRQLLCVPVLFLALLAPASAQHGGAGGGGLRPAPEVAQFDFLIGDWELEASPKASGFAAMIHGAPRLLGRWTVKRAWEGFGLQDELRLFDAGGNPVALSQGLRLYDAKTQRWQSHSLDVYRARLSSSSGQWHGGEMRFEGQGQSADGKPRLTRSRFYEIGPNGFRWRQDVSEDNGATWEEGSLNIVAKRKPKTAS